MVDNAKISSSSIHGIPEPRQYGTVLTSKEFNQEVMQALYNPRPNGNPTKEDETLAERIPVSEEHGEG